MIGTCFDASWQSPMSPLEIEGKNNKWNPSELNLIISIDRREEPDFLLFLLNRLYITPFQDDSLPLPHLPIFYLRGAATYFNSTVINWKYISDLSLELQLINRAISQNIRNNMGGSVAWETRIHEKEQGIFRFPPNNLKNAASVALQIVLSRLFCAC